MAIILGLPSISLVVIAVWVIRGNIKFNRFMKQEEEKILKERETRKAKMTEIAKKLKDKSIAVIVRLGDGKQTGFETRLINAFIEAGAKVAHVSKGDAQAFWKGSEPSMSVSHILLATYADVDSVRSLDVRVLSNHGKEIAAATQIAHDRVRWNKCYRCSDDREEKLIFDTLSLAASVVSSPASEPAAV